ncbi:MAG: serine--tRNA ligase, partial [Patescibacteria group bacterium]
KKKHIEVDIDRLLSIDDKRRSLMGEVEGMRAKQNEVSKAVAAGGPERGQLIADMKVLKAEMDKKEAELEPIVKEWETLMVQVPNVPDISVPEGDSDADNAEVKVWGDKPVFDFEPKSHIEIMERLGMADFERDTKVAGFRGYFLKGDGALLAFAVLRYAQEHLSKKGFTPMIVPSMVRRVNFLGTGYVPQSEEDLYKTQDNDYLAGTGEVATMGYYMGEVLDKKSLPLKLMAFSPCFRREIGAHGKDTKGIVRVHEFYKWEQVVLCEGSHEESVAHHEALTQNAEEILQGLGLPYHVVLNCGGDIGLGQVKKYDIEAWVPSEQKYRETHSSSYFHDFQTRRLNIKYRDDDGSLKYAHSLNNTAIAIPRFLVPLIENNQQADGTVRVPPALVPYMGKEILG